MTAEGTVTDGRVVFDTPGRFPDGTRVRVVVAVAEREMAILRESLADAAAGRTRPFDDAMDEIAARHGLTGPRD